MNSVQRLALIAAICSKLGTSAKVSAVMFPSRHDVREEISLVETTERGNLPVNEDFPDVAPSKSLLSSFES